MRTLQDVVKDVKSEFKHQDKSFDNNDTKPFEVWLLLASQYMKEAVERYAHASQVDARNMLLKAVTCGIRALKTETITHKQPDVTFVDGDDWDGIYVDGNLKVENHCLDIGELCEATGIKVNIIAPDEDWLAENGSLPELLKDVKEYKE
jgi:hypothetical protein